MIPLRDNVSSSRLAILIWTIILANGWVFYEQLWMHIRQVEAFTFRFGLLPARFRLADKPGPIFVLLQESTNGLERTHHVEVYDENTWHTVDQESLWSPLSQGFNARVIELNNDIESILGCLITTMFLHGGWMHLIGNMWYLRIFGSTVEGRIGHFRFLLLYLGSGILGSLSHLLVNWNRDLPAIGASGAVAGVLGAYMRLHPFAGVLTFIPPLWFFGLIEIPAMIWLGVWFSLQFWTGTESLAGGDTGVAWWAHIGGFISGFYLAGKLSTKPVRRKPAHPDKPLTR